MGEVGEVGEVGSPQTLPTRVVTEDSAKFEFDVCSLSIFVVSIHKNLHMQGFVP